MASKKSDLKFKYVNRIPAAVTGGTFYWKYENGRNQLYFSPTDNRSDVLRLDNIISGQGGSMIGVSEDVTLVAIYDAPAEQVIINQQEGTVSAWSDDDWENYVTSVTETEKYGNISDKPFSRGNIVICGDREFICKNVQPVCSSVTIDGVAYYKKKGTDNEPCVDADNVRIRFDGGTIPDDAEVVSYSSIEWECFGDNLSRDLAEKIANYTVTVTGDKIVKVEDLSNGGYPNFRLSVVIREDNPLSVTTDVFGERKVEISESQRQVQEDPDGELTLMSAKQIKEIINGIVGMQWIDEIIL